LMSDGFEGAGFGCAAGFEQLNIEPASPENVIAKIMEQK